MSFTVSELIWYCQTNTVRVSFSGSFGILWIPYLWSGGYGAKFVTKCVGKQHPGSCETKAAQSGRCWSLAKRSVSTAQPSVPKLAHCEEWAPCSLTLLLFPESAEPLVGLDCLSALSAAAAHRQSQRKPVQQGELIKSTLNTDEKCPCVWIQKLLIKSNSFLEYTLASIDQTLRGLTCFPIVFYYWVFN